MLLRKLNDAPEKIVPVGMGLLVVGLSITVIGANWLRSSTPLAHAGTDWNDFFHGLILGLGLALEIAGIALTARAAALKKRKSA